MKLREIINEAKEIDALLESEVYLDTMAMADMFGNAERDEKRRQTIVQRIKGAMMKIAKDIKTATSDYFTKVPDIKEMIKLIEELQGGKYKSQAQCLLKAAKNTKGKLPKHTMVQIFKALTYTTSKNERDRKEGIAAIASICQSIDEETGEITKFGSHFINLK